MSQTPENRLPGDVSQACSGRLERLRSSFATSGVDALIVDHGADIRYLTGFSGEDSYVIVTTDGAVIITDPRQDEFLNPWRESGFIDVDMGVRHRLPDAVGPWCASNAVNRLGIQAEHLTVAARSALAGTVGSTQLVDTIGLVGSLRIRKDALEVARIERAGVIQTEAISAALEHLRIGMSELEFCAILESEMKTRGSTSPSFGTMVSSGPNSSIIHHETGETPIGEGGLLIDWGATFAGYCSDMTRTFAVGDFPPKIQTIYGIVSEAQQAAIEAIAPGKPCASIDKVARDIITDAGYGPNFDHGLGHGLGIDVHEDPYFNDLATDTLLEPGMVMTVEPGIYIPGVGGVRIEDDVLITEDGYRILTSFPKDPESMVIQPGAVQGVA